MPVAVQCPNCGQRYQVAEPVADKPVKCGKCGTLIPHAKTKPATAPGPAKAAPPRRSAEKPSAPLADFLNEELLTSGPRVAAPASPPSALETAAMATSRAPALDDQRRRSGFGGWIARHRLMTLLLVVAMVMFLLYGVAGHVNAAAFLLVSAAVIAGIGCLGHNEPVERIIATGIGMLLAGIVICGSLINLVMGINYLTSLGPRGTDHIFSLVCVVLLSTAVVVGVIALHFYFCATFGFFRTFAWEYITFFGALPLLIASLIALPANRQPFRLMSAKRFDEEPSKLSSVPLPMLPRPTDPGQPFQPPPAVLPSMPPVTPPVTPPATPLPAPGLKFGRVIVTGKVAWQAARDPAAPFVDPAGDAPLPLGNEPGDREVGFSAPSGGRVVVYYRPPPAAPQAARPPSRLQAFDLPSRLALGSIDLPTQDDARSRLQAVSPSGKFAYLQHVDHGDVWALDEGRVICQIPLRRCTWAGFASDDLLFVLADRTLVLWRFPGPEPVYQVPRVFRAALSPGRQYLVCLQVQFSTGADQPAGLEYTGMVLAAASGEVRGNLVVDASAKPLTEVMEPVMPLNGATVALYAPDGRLAAWDMQTGSRMLGDVQLGRWTHRLRLFPGGRLMAGDFWAELGPPLRVWNCKFATDARPLHGEESGGIDDRSWHLFALDAPPAQFLVPLHMAEALKPLLAKPPESAVAADFSLPALLAQRVRPYADAVSQPPEQPFAAQPAAAQPAAVAEQPRIPAPDLHPASPELAETVSGQLLQVYADLLAADDAAFESQMRWYAVGKQPLLGLRWGLGVAWIGTANPTPVNSAESLQWATGSLGARLIDGLQQRTASGRFGDWTKPSGAALPHVVLLGSGAQNELAAAAQRYGLDVMAAVFLQPRVVGFGKKRDMTLRVRLIDVRSRHTLWTSDMVSGSDVTAGGDDALAALAAKVLKQVDTDFALQPLPALTAEQVKPRLAALRAAHGQMGPLDLLPWAAEIRLYQARRLLSSDEAVAAYDSLFGAGQGATFASGTAAQRRTLIEHCLTAPARTAPPAPENAP